MMTFLGIIFTILFFVGILSIIFEKQITDIYWLTVEDLIKSGETELVDLMFKFIQ